MAIETVAAFSPLVRPSLFFPLALAFGALGLLCTGRFMGYAAASKALRCQTKRFLLVLPRYQLTHDKVTRQLGQEIRLAVFASVFLAFGTLFLMLSLGLYV